MWSGDEFPLVCPLLEKLSGDPTSLSGWMLVCLLWRPPALKLGLAITKELIGFCCFWEYKSIKFCTIIIKITSIYRIYTGTVAAFKTKWIAVEEGRSCLNNFSWVFSSWLNFIPWTAYKNIGVVHWFTNDKKSPGLKEHQFPLNLFSEIFILQESLIKTISL